MTEVATRPSAWPGETVSDWDGTIERRPATVQPTQGERMREWLHLFKECREAAEILSRTSFVPKEMQGKPAEAAVSMMKGWELGLDPLDALASIFVVHGRVGFYAEFMRRRVIQAGHTFRVVESTDSRSVVEGTRADTGETHKAAFTKEQAARAKIDIAAYPADKLLARATSRLVKQAFPDVLSGSLIVEDLLDGLISVESERLDAPAQETAEAPALQRRTRTARKAPAPKAESSPAPATDLDEFPAEPEPEPETQPAPAEPEPADAEPETENAAEQGITDPQLKKLHVLFGKHGLNERQAGLDWLTAATGREITSSKDLTLREAIKVIDTLESDEALQDENR
ncbi:hypothetical protein A3N99_02675 [Mycobacteroides abscessus]|uniref:hypothetical protein n=1 Tax=Mycobacteroides abscessus TaxID=36809 RepID=UPI00078B78BE|nr:hypothetical protein [Mycobacteroides abscessus]AMU39217.1 hypothetical protein A3N99_02675 [Mycobacteroides abscessus]